MHGLSIRKVPGIGRVNERLLEAIGIKVSEISLNTAAILTVTTFLLFVDLW